MISLTEDSVTKVLVKEQSGIESVQMFLRQEGFFQASQNLAFAADTFRRFILYQTAIPSYYHYRKGDHSDQNSSHVCFSKVSHAPQIRMSTKKILQKVCRYIYQDCFTSIPCCVLTCTGADSGPGPTDVSACTRIVYTVCGVSSLIVVRWLLSICWGQVRLRMGDVETQINQCVTSETCMLSVCVSYL